MPRIVLEEHLNELLLICDLFLGLWMHYKYRLEVRTLQNMQNAPELAPYHIDYHTLVKQYSALNKTDQIPYVAVHGRITPLRKNAVLYSTTGNASGVLQTFQVVESIRRLTSGNWAFSNRYIHEKINTIDFGLSDVNSSSWTLSSPIWRVDSLTEAKDLDSALTTIGVGVDFESSETFLQTIIGALAKGLGGVQTTEKMLKVGTQLTILGHLVKSSDGTIHIKPTGNVEFPFMVTTRQLPQLLEQLENELELLGWLTFIHNTGVVFGLGYYLVNYLFDWYFRKILNKIRQCRDPNSNDENYIDGLPDYMVCTVCMGNVREVIFLPCAHYCVCADCCEHLKKQRLCPICKATIWYISPVYIS